MGVLGSRHHRLVPAHCQSCLSADPPWLQRPSWGGKLATVLRAVPTTAQGEAGSLLWGLGERGRPPGERVFQYSGLSQSEKDEGSDPPSLPCRFLSASSSEDVLGNVLLPEVTVPWSRGVREE